MKNSFLLFAVFCSLILTCLSGCGEKMPAGMPKLFPAQITLTYDDGKPVTDAMLILIADQGSSVGTWSHTGNTDEQGKAEIYTQGRYKGLPAATFKVTVVKEIREGTPNPGEPVDAESAKKYEDWKKSSNKEKVYKVVEETYENAAKTPISVTVAPQGPNAFNLKVGKEVKILQRDASF